MSNAERVQNLLAGASELPPARRAAYLEAACGENAKLREEVESLLRSLDDAGPFLSAPTGQMGSNQTPTSMNAPTVAMPAIEREGQMIGRYKLLQPIGEGGFGSVWMAEQREPVKRRVALKIIKMGMDTKQVIARFEAERQALAMMDHPNIAKVLDAGATETGRPYFVMDYIKGVPILEHCDTEKLDTKARLALFNQVCHAIQHAHQKGIIHRDIKPSNVLITLHDGVPVPKVIDFGIAKATNSELTAKTLFTEHRQMIGTPVYMSPEQAEMSGLDIDTRSDIYSLGVLLYEMLTGTTPFTNEDLLSRGFAEMMRIIREVEPHKPSTRLSSLGQAVTRTAEQRQVDPKHLNILLRGDLDWIVMKCLEKDRTRRYETANGLAADIQRHLNDEPITAGAPGTVYRLRKFARRNRGPVVAGLIVFTTLVLGVAGTSAGMMSALSEKAKATLAAESEGKAKEEADRKRQDAETHLEYARRGNAVLGSIFAKLNPKQDYETVAELRNALKDNLAKAVQDLEHSPIGDPLAVADIKITLGGSLVGLGAAEQAIPLLLMAWETRRARLGPDHSETLGSMHELAIAYWEVGDLEQAIPMSEEMVRRRIATLGPDHPLTLASMNNLALAYTYAQMYDKSIPLFEDLLVLQSSKLGRDHPDTSAILMNLGMNYKEAGRPGEAISLLEEAFTLAKASRGPDHPDTLNCMTNLAQAYDKVGDYDLALPLYEETIERAKARLGPEHPHTLKTLASLAYVYWSLNRFEKSVPIYEAILRVKETKFGKEHAETLKAAADLGSNYVDANRTDEAIALLESTYRVAMAKHGENHPATRLCMGNLAVAYQAVGRLDLALPLTERALAVKRAALNEDDTETLLAMNNLAATYWRLGQLDKSIPLFKEALSLHESRFGKSNPVTLQIAANLGVNFTSAGRLDEAIPLLEATLGRYQAVSSPQHPLTLACMTYLARAYQAANRLDMAMPLYTQTLELRKRVLGANHHETHQSMHDIAVAHWAGGRYDQSIPLLEDLLNRREANLGRDHPSTLTTVGDLGVNYADAGRMNDAIPLLLEAHRGAKKYPQLPAYGLNLLNAYAKAADPGNPDDTQRVVSLVQELLVAARATLPNKSPALASQLATVSQSLLWLKAWNEAEPLIRECLAIRERTQPDVWVTFNTRSMLGGVLLGQNKLAEAEPLLLSGYLGMKEREAAIPPQGNVRILESIERLVRIYEALGHEAEAATWRTKLDTYLAEQRSENAKVAR